MTNPAITPAIRAEARAMADKFNRGYLAAYDEGYAAFPTHKESDNPYTWYTVEYAGWQWGRRDAKLINSRSETLYPLTTMEPTPEKFSKTT